MKATRTRLLQATLILFPLMLGGCEAASSLRAAGLSDPKLMKSINDAYEARDNCLTANIHLADSGNAKRPVARRNRGRVPARRRRTC